MTLSNGQVWQSDKGERVLTQWLGGVEWILLSTPAIVDGWIRMMPVVRRISGFIWYHPDPLEHWLIDHGWKPTEITVVENL